MNRVIWMFWDTGQNISSAATKMRREKDIRVRRMSVQGWRKLNPTWTVRVLNMASASVLAPRYAAVSRNRGHSALCIPLQADLLRAELLSLYGGVWADVTTVPLYPLDQWLSDLLVPAGFWAFTDNEGGSGIEKLRRFGNRTRGACLRLPHSKTKQAKNCQPSWVYDNYHAVQGPVNWFLAVDRPHHPLMDAWLEEYSSNLRLAALDERGPPYFIQSCSLTAVASQYAVRRTLEAMPTPCGGTDVRSVKGGRRHDAVDPGMLMYKRPIFAEKKYDEWLALQKGWATAPRRCQKQ